MFAPDRRRRFEYEIVNCEMNWHIEQREVDSLEVFESNPRRFTDKGLKDLERSIANVNKSEGAYA